MQVNLDGSFTGRGDKVPSAVRRKPTGQALASGQDKLPAEGLFHGLQLLPIPVRFLEALLHQVLRDQSIPPHASLSHRFLHVGSIDDRDRRSSTPFALGPPSARRREPRSVKPP